MADKDGIGWATNAMMAAYDRMEVANENLANTNSRDFHTVLEHIIATPTGLRAVHTVSRQNQGQHETGRDLDLAIDGPGVFRVADPAGDHAVSQTRVGAFSTSSDGFLVDSGGRQLLGDHGPIKVGPSAKVRGDGWIIDNGKMVAHISVPAGSQIRSGYLELSNVDSAKTMLDVIDAQRSFETASKVISAIDATRQKEANEVARLKG